MRYDDNDIQRIEENQRPIALRKHAKIADDLGIDVETVRNYFGGDHYEEGKAVGIHFEKGPEGGIVQIDDTTILEKAKQMLEN